MSYEPNKIIFVEGKKYLTDKGDTAVCKKIFQDESIVFEINKQIRAFNKYGKTLSNGGKLTIISEYMEPLQEKTPPPFDWTKPAQTKNGLEVKELHKFDLPIVYPLVGIIKGGAYSHTWTITGKSSISNLYDLINISETKKVVPLEPGDIKPGDIIKQKSNLSGHEWSMVTSVSKYINGLPFVTCSLGTISVVTLVNNYLISHDNGVTWEDCSKEV